MRAEKFNIEHVAFFWTYVSVSGMGRIPAAPVAPDPAPATHPGPGRPQQEGPMLPEPYLVVHQSRDREPGEYENLLGDALERLFGLGIAEIDPLVAGLNDLDAPAPDGARWTRELLLSELARLGA